MLTMDCLVNCSVYKHKYDEERYQYDQMPRANVNIIPFFPDAVHFLF